MCVRGAVNEHCLSFNVQADRSNDVTHHHLSTELSVMPTFVLMLLHSAPFNTWDHVNALAQLMGSLCTMIKKRLYFVLNYSVLVQ